MIVIRIGRFVVKLGTTTDEARAEAHTAFDPLWQQSGGMSRNAAYRWLAEELGMNREDCHMSLFDEETCRRVVGVCAQKEERS